ncbi:choice-of-anchor A domain-containing protein [Sediminibacterium ginsengisoli]|uniref:Choice-of-anchor A domain-containing protein n=2 Tax=Sediminibacterium ginsengisoli TaxID=413434 RepID=A0A1T4LFJ0_9BACT|nr:choice-of-anchor A domain-containing protein [Sediminibacterium ginsengisoli]
MIFSASAAFSQTAGALNFDGQNDQVTIPNKPALNPSTAITIEAWIYPTNGSSSVQNVICKSSVDENSGYIFPRTDDGWMSYSFYLKINDEWQILSAPFPSLFQWHHVAATYDGSMMKLYIDGNLTASMAASGPVSANNNPLVMGQQPGYEEAFGGNVDEVRLWNRALTECEIRNNMLCELPVPQNGLVAYYQFNQGLLGGVLNTLFATLPDKSGNNNDGTLENFFLNGLTSNWVAGKATGTCTVFAAPAPVVGSNGPVLIAGSTLNLTASGGTSYSWTGPNGFTSNQQNPTIANAQISASGTYTVYVSRNGCTESATIDISIVAQAGGLHFDGVNDQVTVPHNASLNMTDAISLEALIYPTDKIRPRQDVMTKSTLTENTGYIFPRTDDGWDSFVFYLNIEGKGWQSLSAPYPDINKWHHVAATYDGSFMKVYLDGVLVASRQMTGKITTNTNAVVLGQQPGYDEYFTGKVDEARIWSRALTQCEISNNMLCELPASQIGLAAYYKFNQGLPAVANPGITSLTDASGNNNDGQLENFALNGATSNWLDGRASGTCNLVTPVLPEAGNNGPVVAVGSVLNLTASGGQSYSWTGPSGFTSTMQNPSIGNAQVSASGTYTVTVTSGGCSATAQTKVTVAVPAKGLNFDGIDDEISIPNNTSLNVSNAISVEAWIYPTNKTRLVQDVLAKSSRTNNTGYIFPRTDDGWDSFTFYLNITGQGWVSLTAPYAAVNQWNHVAATYDGTAMKIYLNGVLAGSRPMTGAITTNTNALRLGNQDGYEEFFAGNVDEIRVWNRALPVCEILNNMNCEVVPQQQTGLSAYYRFNQGYIGIDNTNITTSLSDETANNNSGTFINFALNGATSNWVVGKVSGNCSVFIPVIATIGSNGPVLPIGSTIQLSAGGGDTYMWTGPNGFASTLQNPSVINAQINATGNYLVAVTARNCTDTISKHITIRQLPTITAVGPVSFCPGGSVKLIATLSQTYQWYRNGTLIPGATQREYIATASGSYTVSVTDAGNFAATSAATSVLATDNLAPVPTVANLPVITGDYPLMIVTTPTATDNCAGTVAATTNSPLVYNIPGTYTIHWTYNDGNGNTITQDQTVVVTGTIADQTPPVISGVPANSTVNCGNIPAAVTPVVTDNMDPSPVVTFAETSTKGTNPAAASFYNYTITRKWTATDASGNVATATQVITVQDITAPVLSGVPANVTVSCGSIPAAATVTATDACDANPAVTLVETSTKGTNPAAASFYNYTITRKWTGKDASNNITVGTQVITVQDVTAPVLSGVPANVTVNCGAIPAAATVTATDACDANPVVTLAEVSTKGTNASAASYYNYTITRTWTGTDAANNTVTGTQVITVQDIAPPMISGVPANVTVICGSIPAPANVAAADACDANPVVTLVETSTKGTNATSAAYYNYTITRKWTAKDATGNTTSGTQVITVQDVAAPVLSGVPANAAVNCGSIPAAAAVTATDACDANPVIAFTEISTKGTNPSNISYYNYTITRKWKATDAAGNSSAEATQVITVTDNTAPVLTGVPANVTVNCGSVPAAPVVTATDACDPAPVVTLNTVTNGNTITRTWTAKDAAGNTVTATQVITVTGTAPVITGPTTGTTVTMNPVAPALDFNVFVRNGVYFGNGQSHGAVAMGGDLTLAGNYSVSNNNAGTFKVNNVPVTLVVGGKVIYQSGNNVNVNQNGYVKIGDATNSYVWYKDQNNAYSPIRITPGNNYNGSPRINMQANSQNLNVSATNNPVFQSNVIDFAAAFAQMQASSAGMSAMTDNANVTTPNGTAIPHTNMPNQVKITLAQGVNVLNINASDLNNVQNFTFNNQPDASRILIINVNAPGNFNWNVWNSGGVGDQNSSYILYNFYNTTALTVQGNGSITGTLFAPYASINKSSSQNITGQIIGQSFTHSSGTNTYNKFTGTITSGSTTVIGSNSNNQRYTTATSCTYLVNGNEFTPTATDNCGTPVLTYVLTGATTGTGTSLAGVALNKGTTTITWTATSALSSTYSFNVTVDDNVNPAAVTKNITVALDENGNAVITPQSVNNGSSDNCGIVTYALSKTNFTAANIGANTVTLTVMDAAGNTASATAVVTITDNTAPVINVPAAINKNNDNNVNGAVVNYTVTAADNSGAAPVLTYSKASGSVFPIGTTVVTVTAKDAAGNTSTATFNVVIKDVQAPVLNIPADITANYGSVINLGNATASDNAGISAQGITNNAPAVFPLGVTMVTWSVTDVNGNTTTAVQKVTVVDATPPVITVPAAISRNNDNNACGAVVTYTVTATDNSGIAPVLTYSKASGTSFPVGTTVVTVTAKDAANNTSTATFNVVVKDVQAPVITAPADITINSGANFNLGNAVVSDNCGINAQGARNNAPSTFPVGTTTVTWTVTDLSGNTATATQLVTVLSAKPVLVSPGNQAFCANQNGSKQFTIPALQQSSAIGISSTTYAITGATSRTGSGVNASGNFNNGTSTITWTVKDKNNNVSTCAITVVVTALPAAPAVTASTPDAFCSSVQLVAATQNNVSYQWVYNNNIVGEAQQLNLGSSDGEGTYTVYAINGGGCKSAGGTYSYNKQNLSGSYVIIGTKEVDLGQNNQVNGGSVGVTASNGIASFDKNTSVLSAGSFVKASRITKNATNVNILKSITSAATISLPAMIYNRASTKGLSGKDVAQNVTTTLNGNFSTVTLRKGSNVTLTGTIFGVITMEEGAQLRFTSTTVNIDQLKLANGPANGYSYVRFADNTNVLVSTQVSVGSNAIINPDGVKVTFYVGDTRCDEEKFTVKGADTRINANIYMPDGKLKISNTSSSNSSCIDYDSWWKWILSWFCGNVTQQSNVATPGDPNVYMTGMFIAYEVESTTPVIWNANNCGGNPVTSVNTAVTSATSEPEAIRPAGAETLKVTVMPNPTTTYFTLKLEGKSGLPVNIRVVDATGKLVDAKLNQNANSTLQIGHNYGNGMFYAEITQGTQRQVLKLIKLHP